MSLISALLLNIIAAFSLATVLAAAMWIPFRLERRGRMPRRWVRLDRRSR